MRTRRTEALTVRCSDEELAALRDLAIDRDCSVSALLRESPGQVSEIHDLIVSWRSAPDPGDRGYLAMIARIAARKI